ncbi:MAG TPA: hypothetical protein VH436_35850 [Vicinamibacterales bacterium]|jgi:hypothetical protein
MRFSQVLFVVLVSGACVAGCRQPDGAWPAENGDTPNRLHDLSRDLQSVAGGEADAPKDLADDLAVFADKPAGVSAARNLADGLSTTIRKRSAGEDVCKQMASILWKAVASRELSERQIDSLKDDMRGALTSLGVSQSDANSVADRIGQTQQAVSVRTRRWYERY